MIQPKGQPMGKGFAIAGVGAEFEAIVIGGGAPEVKARALCNRRLALVTKSGQQTRGFIERSSDGTGVQDESKVGLLGGD